MWGWMGVMRRMLGGCLLGWVGMACGQAGVSAAAAARVPAANPARPTVTIPAALPPVGYVQLEQGFVEAGGSPGGVARQFGVSQVTKLAIAPRLLVQVLSQPYAESGVADGAGRVTESNDPGDVQVGALGVIHASKGARPTVSAGYIRRARAGTSASLDVGESSQSGLALFGGDLRGGVHYDSNLLWSEQDDGRVRRGQTGQTLALTRGLFPVRTKGRLSGIVELSHFTQPLVKAGRDGMGVARANAVDLLFAGTWTPRPNLVLDASVVRGMTSTSTSWQGGVGVSYLLPRRVVGAR